MDKPVKGIPKSGNQTLRQLAVKAIDETEWVPQSGENRILGMVEGRPDWVVSRQRAWGVPITVFRNKETGEVIPSAKFAKSKELIRRITQAFAEKGADVWFEDGATERFLAGLVDDLGAVGAGARHPRRVVRFGLDARLHAGGPGALPDARRRQARARRRQGPRHVPRRLRPASRLVPVVAARNPAARVPVRPTTSC